MEQMPKELIRDNGTGQLRPPSDAELQARDAMAAAAEQKRLANLLAQYRMDKMTMHPVALDRKWTGILTREGPRR